MHLDRDPDSLNNQNIAVLITCYNRVEITIKCLQYLYNLDIPENFIIDIYLVDDNSPDNTGQKVKELFPQVHLIYGTGSLYWNGGMRLAWNTAAKNLDYDFYFWLNDDVILDKDSLKELLDCYEESYKRINIPAIITGACRSHPTLLEFSYGGRNETEPVIPNGQIQKCTYINGNAVIVPRSIFKVISSLSPDYTHALGDFDYGIRAIKAGFVCYTTKKYIAYCEINASPKWSLSSTPIFKRFKLLYSVKGLNMREYLCYQRRVVGWKWILFLIKAYLKALSPSFYNKASLIILKFKK